MSPKPDVSEERRAQIVESAVTVFARDGFASARMDDVAAQAGVSKGLLYWYFKSKEEIIIAIADRLFGGEFRKLQELSQEGQSARECIERFLAFFMEDLRGMLKVMPVIYEFYALAFRNKTVRHVMQSYLGRFAAILEPVLQQGMESGEFAAADAHQAVLAVGSVLEGTLLMYAYAPDLFELEEQLNAGMALLLDGLEMGKRTR